MLQAQHRREPRCRDELRNSKHPDNDNIQERGEERHNYWGRSGRHLGDKYREVLVDQIWRILPVCSSLYLYVQFDAHVDVVLGE